MDASEAKYIKMTTYPVSKLIIQLAIPTIISMLISAIYNMADTFFVGQIGTSASGGIGISFSLMAVVQAIGFTFGAGSGNNISKLLGQKNYHKASRVAATGFFTSFIFGVFLAVTVWIFIDPIVRFLGATPTIFPHAKDYVKFILLGIPFMISSLVLNNILRYQGSAFYSMFGIGIGGIINIGLDPLFIFVFNMGTGGAALATSISQFISFCILLFATTRGSNIRIKFKEFTPKWRIYKEILRTGIPSFYRQGLASAAIVCLNQAARPYGDPAIAAMSIVSRIMMFAISALIGFGQGFQPVCGFNYGARFYNRVSKAFWFCFRVAVIALVIIGTIGFIFAPEAVALFRKDDPAVIEIGTRALRLQCITFPLSSWFIMNNMMFQTIGKSTKASILALARQGMFFMPAILILPGLFGIAGIQLSQPIADLATFCLSVPMGISELRELKALSSQREGQ